MIYEGIVIGLLIAIIVLLVALRYTPTIQRTINRQQSKLTQKGSIIEPEDTNLEQWLDELPHETPSVS